MHNSNAPNMIRCSIETYWHFSDVLPD